MQSKIIPAGLILLVVWLSAGVLHCTYPADRPGNRQTTTLWHPYAEWEFANPSYTGNPFDLDAEAVFSDGRKPHLFYDGDGVWKLRYMCVEEGAFSFVIHSSDADLDGRTGEVVCRGNEDGMGLLTPGGRNNERFYVQGWEKAIVPVWAMFPGNPTDGWPDRKDMDEWIQNHIRSAGFIGVHHSGPANAWYDWTCDGTRSGCDWENPDPAAFEYFEALMERLYQEGAFIHIWLFGDCQRDACDLNHDHIRRQERFRRYLADRWGAIPNWMIGEGFDNFEDDDTAYANKFFHDIDDRLAWPHFIGMRSYKNSYKEICTECNYRSFENIADPHDWTYERFAQTFDHARGKPVFEEDRFRYSQDESRFRKKDVADLTEQRRWMWWQAMSGGVGAIYGNLDNAAGHWSSTAGYPDDWEQTIRAWHDFWYASDRDPVHRFHSDFARCHSRTSGYGLCAGENYVFYGEDTDRITFDLALSSPATAIAMDAKIGQIIDLGPVDGAFAEFEAPYESDWVVAVGRF